MPLENTKVGHRLTDLAEYFTADDLDRAVDQSARVVRAVVAEFAAVTAVAADGRPAVELAVEFFVAPAAVELFTTQLDDCLMQGSVSPPRVHPVAMGAFHQWRVAWRRNQSTTSDSRWSKDRELSGSA